MSGKKEIADLTDMLYQGYLSHESAVLVARHPEAYKLSPKVESNQFVPIGRAKKKEGRPVEYSFDHFLRLGSNNPAISEQMERVWLAGSLLTLGDALNKVGYLDRSPLLELVRHLRNGVAHGNRFRIDRPDRLSAYPAHNKDSPIRGWDTRIFEITRELDGQPVLFDFMEPGDIAEHLLAVHVYVGRMSDK